MRAFTFIEMVLVLSLAAVIAAAVTLSLAGPRRAARAEDVADQVTNYDRLARESARRTGRPVHLAFDLDRGTISRTTGDSEGQQPSALRLPGGFRIARLLSPGRSDTAGEVSLPCSSRGQTPTYAVLLAGPGGQQQWLLVAGLSGKVQSIQDAREVEAIFETFATPGQTAAGDDAP